VRGGTDSDHELITLELEAAERFLSG